jgi:hypothetical protein
MTRKIRSRSDWLPWGKALFLLLLACFLPAPGIGAAVKRGTITAEALVNPTVGFSGYYLPIPAGYKAVLSDKTPPDMDAYMKLLFSEWKGTFGEGGEKGRLLRFEESFVIYKDQVAFLFGVCVPGNNFVLSDLSDFQCRQLLAGCMKSAFRGQEGVKTEIIIRDKKRSAHAQIEQIDREGQFGGGEYCAELYFVLGRLNEMFCLVGMSKMTDKAAMQQVGRELFNNLQFKAKPDKPKPGGKTAGKSAK